jgi:hypothetical protein
MDLIGAREMHAGALAACTTIIKLVTSEEPASSGLQANEYVVVGLPCRPGTAGHKATVVSTID